MKTPLLFAVAVFAAAQTPEPRPEFDAASIRLNTDGGPIVFNGMESLGTFASVNQTLRNLVQEAYGHPSGRRNWLPYFQAPGEGVPIFGGPSWFGDDRWNITAKWNAAPANGNVTMKFIETEQARMELMLQTLLEQRFQVKLHREKRDLPVYELTIAKPGKLKRTNCTVFDPENIPPVAPDYCGASREGRKGMDWTLDGNGMKMSELASTLSWLIGGRNIVDKTGFEGTFDAHLRCAPIARRRERVHFHRPSGPTGAEAQNGQSPGRGHRDRQRGKAVAKLIYRAATERERLPAFNTLLHIAGPARMPANATRIDCCARVLYGPCSNEITEEIVSVNIRKITAPSVERVPSSATPTAANWLVSMVGTGRITGDIVSPASEESDWEVLQG